MSYLKPALQHPSLPKNALGFTRRDYEGALSTLCAGCGHDSITAAIVEAAWEISLEPQNLVKLSGIGCSSKTTAYFVSGGSEATTGVLHANARVKIIPKLSLPSDGATSSFAAESSSVRWSSST